MALSQRSSLRHGDPRRRQMAQSPLQTPGNYRKPRTLQMTVRRQARSPQVCWQS
ncbi:MAG: hypothetical protein RMJ43_15250 [Chloroherpetonaceae bacterium]|nr:hypothetical protein [Chthonomonadaceae bacterium]MDW8209190.1 hypothetical protein [Chloroherpetonaceae bacterium]